LPFWAAAAAVAGKGRRACILFPRRVVSRPGLAFPRVLQPIHRAWMALALVLSWVMTRVILALTFYLMITPLGLLMRLFGYRFLDLSWGDSRETFWHSRPDQEPQAKYYERQF
jgi:hypothetical protein